MSTPFTAPLPTKSHIAKASANKKEDDITMTVPALQGAILLINWLSKGRQTTLFTSDERKFGGGTPTEIGEYVRNKYYSEFFHVHDASQNPLNLPSLALALTGVPATLGKFEERMEIAKSKIIAEINAIPREQDAAFSKYSVAVQLEPEKAKFIQEIFKGDRGQIIADIEQFTFDPTTTIKNVLRGTSTVTIDGDVATSRSASR